MSTTTVSDLARLVKNGQLAEAKRLARTVLADTEPHDLQVIAQCAHILETWPRIGVLKLRAYWHNANEHDRAIIATCAPEPGEQRSASPSDDRTPRWTRRNKYQAPRDVRHEIRPELRRSPRPTRDEPVVVAYDHERAGLDDFPTQRGEQPAGYSIDYDHAAVPALRGTPCVRCWLERSARDTTSRQDDGLCTECRGRGRTGVPVLPSGHSRADAVQARCAFISITYPHLAIKLLRRYWQSATPTDRTVIGAWARNNTATTPADDTKQPTSTEPDTCASCREPRTTRDTRHITNDDHLCAPCREIDDTTADS